jgi:hypothetical protein
LVAAGETDHRRASTFRLDDPHVKAEQIDARSRYESLNITYATSVLVFTLLWATIGVVEIVRPGVVVRWRRAWLTRRPGGGLTQRVAQVVDSFTREADAPDAWKSPSVLRRVRVIGIVNLALAACFGVVLLTWARAA